MKKVPEDAFPRDNLNSKDSDDGDHGQPSIPCLGTLGPAPLPEVHWGGNSEALTVECGQECVEVTCKEGNI